MITRASNHIRRRSALRATVGLVVVLCCVAGAASERSFEIPPTDEGLPGAGPIRRYDWFKELWQSKRSAWAKDVEKDQHALVFLGNSITQGWGPTMGGAFPGVKVANRGISGDTTRGMLIRLAEDVLALQHLVRRVPAPESLVRAAITLARMTRPTDAEAPAFVKEYISWGAGPRASQYLVLGAKARAALDGRPMADYDDLKTVAATVLTHRLVINFAAEAAGRGAPDLVSELLSQKRWMAS